MRWSRSHAAGVSRNGSRPILADHCGPGNRFLAPPTRLPLLPPSLATAFAASLAAARVAGQRSGVARPVAAGTSGIGAPVRVPELDKHGPGALAVAAFFDEPGTRARV
jgi:hypothetical protein